MSFIKRNFTFTKNEAQSWPIPNYWDVIALLLVIALIFVFGFGAKSMLGEYHLGQHIPISLNPAHLPYYALRTVLRMFIAMFFSLLATFTLGTWAAKSRRAERLIVPIIDICQSVPILGFQAIAIIPFIMLFHGSLLGPEAAAVFALFTSQAWNMILSFYQNVRSIPYSLREASQVFQLSAWQNFWRIDVPYALPSLVWNAMISMSGGWVFVVAAEAISVANQHITLPGIGSYIYVAILQQDKTAIFYAIIAMLIVIALYDQLIFRPLIAWMDRFQGSAEDTDEQESWLLSLFHRTEFFQMMGELLSGLSDRFVNAKLFIKKPTHKQWMPSAKMNRFMGVIGYTVLGLVIFIAIYFLGDYLYKNIPFKEILHSFYLGCATTLRVMILVFLSSVIWVPVGVWIGQSKRASRIMQPIVQFVAAFPANLLFPPIVFLILYYHLNVNIWISPLMILGAQWYILFNVIAGAAQMPKALNYTIQILQVTGWLKWRKYILPAVFPYYITGAITAAGGAWNISIIAEAVQWGSQQIYATGLGAYIARASSAGAFPKLVLGIVVMVIFVLVINYFVWKPLYRLARDKYRI